MSEKTVVQKLGMKPGETFLLLNPPEGYSGLLGDLPGDVAVLAKASEPVDIIQCFVKSKQELEKELPRLKGILKPRGRLWIAYPKGTAKIKSDINRDIIREYAETIGLKGVAIFSIDDDWSSLRLKTEK